LYLNLLIKSIGMKTVRSSEEFIFDDQIEWETIGNGIKRKIMGYDDKILLAKVHFETGAIGSMHNHVHSQVTYVESGEYELTIGDVTKTIKAGDSFYIPSNVMHGATCTQEGMLIDVFSPIREDFLPKGQ